MPEIPVTFEFAEITAMMAGESVVEYRVYAIVAGTRRFEAKFDSLNEAQVYASRVTETKEKFGGRYYRGVELTGNKEQ